jgi:hypothetical protein
LPNSIFSHKNIITSKYSFFLGEKQGFCEKMSLSCEKKLKTAILEQKERFLGAGSFFTIFI